MSGMDTAGPVGSASENARKNFLVVAVGGSAGSISSFRQFFRHVPANSGMAYVVILHLSPEHESRLAEVLQPVTRMPVLQVREPVHVEPDHVYVIPPNKSLAMSDGTLLLSDIVSYEERRAPIDIFFRTLAENHDSRAVCVVMSGSGSDGSVGLRRVKEFNGLVLVQDPAEATFGEMPRSCIATGLVDYVVPVAEMPRRILRYREQLRAVYVPDDVEGAGDDEQALMEVLTILRLRTGHDFTNYKRPTVLRRIERRMAVREIDSLPAYAAFLRERREESHALLSELLISVTNFFRDREVWETIETSILPKLLASKQADDHVRVWVPGCATGEEAYTLAMLLAEKAPPKVQIFATDLDEQALTRARDGWYSDTEVADVPPERLRRFFVQDGDGHRIRRELREMVLFAHHNLIKDPPFSHLDFISCRNLLIYLNRAAQQRALEVMHFALDPGGYLLLGTAEAVDGSANLFSLVDKEAHVYAASAVGRGALMPPLPRAVEASDAQALLAEPASVPVLEGRVRERFAPIDLHHRLLEAYAAPSLVADDQHELVHLSERAGRFLQFPRGEATSNVLELIRPELRIDLRSALFQAAQKRTSVAARAVSVHTGEREERIDLIVRPALTDDDPPRGYFLIVFEPASRRADRPAQEEAAAVEPGSPQLEEELLRVKAQMRATIEQYEVQAEEARAANEELQAMNEELRSTTEELETSQEELQSLNEELHTVNQELKVKIDEISHASDDLRNLMSSTDIGTIFVDRSFRVKLFTPRAREVFNLIPSDVGRPLSDITYRLVIDGLVEDMGRVLETLQPIEREVQTRDGAWYLLRLLPYRTSEERIDGIVLTFLDITERHAVEAARRKAEERYRTLFVSMDEGYAVVEMIGEPGAWTDFRFLEVNPAFEKHTGMHVVEGRTAIEILGTPNPRWAQIYGQVAESGEPVRFEETEPVLGRVFDLYAFRLEPPASRRVAVLFNDITRRNLQEAELRESQARLHAIANLVPDLLWMSDPSGATTWYNDRWYAYTGQTREEALGWGWTEAVHPEDRARAVENYAQAVAAGRPLQQEHRIRDASGECRWFLINALPFRDEQGKVVRYYGAATDVDAQRMAREQLEERVRDRTHALLDLSVNRQQLLERLVTAAEEERQRIARELHDEMGQHITALRVGLESLQPQNERLTELKTIITRIDQSIDRLTLELRPPALDELGLHGAITSLADEFSAASGIRVAVHFGIGDGDRFSDAIESTLYRVVQESLTNVWKHSAARTVSVIVERERDALRMIIEDDGRGFDAGETSDGAAPVRGRFGLLGMRERLALVRGTIDVESEPGSGTAIYVRVALNEPESAT